MSVVCISPPRGPTMVFPTRFPVGFWGSASPGSTNGANRRPTATEQRRAALDVKVRIVFETSARTYGSPRVCAQLRGDGERVSEKTVARSMRTQGLVGTAETAPARADPPRTRALLLRRI